MSGKTYTLGGAPGTHAPEPKKSSEQLWEDAKVGPEPGEYPSGKQD